MLKINANFSSFAVQIVVCGDRAGYTSDPITIIDVSNKGTHFHIILTCSSWVITLPQWSAQLGDCPADGQQCDSLLASLAGKVACYDGTVVARLNWSLLLSL